MHWCERIDRPCKVEAELPPRLSEYELGVIASWRLTVTVDHRHIHPKQRPLVRPVLELDESSRRIGTPGRWQLYARQQQVKRLVGSGCYVPDIAERLGEVGDDTVTGVSVHGLAHSAAFDGFEMHSVLDVERF